MEEQLVAVEEALACERSRVRALEAELRRLRSQLAAECLQAKPAASEVPRLASGMLGVLRGKRVVEGKENADGTVTISRSDFDLLRLKDHAFDNVKEGITIADCSHPNMPLIYANKAFTQITGYSLTETLGKNCRFLQGEGTDTETVGKMREAMREGSPCVVQLLNYKKNGDAFVNYLSVTPIRDQAGRLSHFVGVQSDITELVNHKKAELAAKHAAVQAAAATEAKSQFLARMSHEIRTPLNGMIAVGQLLAETSLSPAQWDLVNTIRCSGETLLTLISDILDFSRIEANKMVLVYNQFRLTTVIEAAMEIAGMQAALKRLHVAYHVAKGVPRVLIGDAQRLQQILLNVLNNAVNEEGPLLEVHFSVRDTGIGISRSDLDLLFRSFSQVDASTTRRYGGSGLGLAISQKLCEAMGGAMWAASNGLGCGSTFRWTLSARAPAPAAARRSMERAALARALPDDVPEERVQESGEVARLRLPSSPCRLGPALAPFSMAARDPVGEGGPAGGGGACTEDCPRLERRSMSLERLTRSLSQERGEGAGPATQTRSEGDLEEQTLRLLSGRRVLLVEPCEMVRSVLALDMRAWGCAVCAVASEQAAIARLRLRGGNANGAYSSAAPRAERGDQPADRLRLEHAPAAGGADAEGPFDVCIADISFSRVLHALLQGDDSEAARMIFFGWPGNYEADEAPGPLAYSSFTDGSGSNGGALGNPRLSTAPNQAQAPRELVDGRRRAPGSRQLAYVVVTRPIRQGRLKLALEEVLCTPLAATAPDLDALEAASSGSGSEDCRGGGRGLREWGSGGTSQTGGTGGDAEVQLEREVAEEMRKGLPMRSSGFSSGGSGHGISQRRSIDLSGDGIHKVASGGQLLQACSRKVATTRQPSAEAGEARAAALRVLIAEDNAINMKVATSILARMGYSRVTQARDGQEALDHISARGGPDAFDFILMDLHMPRKGGMEVVMELRARWPASRVRIVAVTADAFEDTRDQCLASGFDGWLSKPFRVEDLAGIMDAILA
ncbi:hypothetical protein WJX81_001725 [Elliptochloris bilobata]|uniref:histidine kinase n=1 Tax=Elliptochloris bilobata TaxID=381761 RepID=A0AAW1S2F2_9CHLO